MAEALTDGEHELLHEELQFLLDIANKRSTYLRDRWASDDYNYLFEIQGLLFWDRDSFENLIFQLVKAIKPQKVPLVSLTYSEQLPILNQIEMLRKLKINR